MCWQRRSHAAGAGKLSPRLGCLGDHRRRRLRPGDQNPTFPAGDGSRMEGHGLRWCSWQNRVPKIVDWYMDGKINIDDLITHTLPLDRINEGFDLMHRGESIRS